MKANLIDLLMSDLVIVLFILMVAVLEELKTAELKLDNNCSLYCTCTSGRMKSL